VKGRKKGKEREGRGGRQREEKETFSPVTLHVRFQQIIDFLIVNFNVRHL